MRGLVIFNPVAGRGRGARVWRQVRGELDQPGWEVAATEGPGHARDLARLAAADGVARVVAIGGDGTAAAVAAGLAGTDTALAIVPAGTGNDFARTLGVPRHPGAAARLARLGVVRTVDLGEVCADGVAQPFLNVAGFGFDAAVVAHANQSRQVGGGTVPYLLGVLGTLWEFQPFPMRLELDGRVVERMALAVAVANGRSYGGGMRIVPDAHPADGLLDVCVIGAMSQLELLRLLPRVYWGGHRGHPRVAFFRVRELHAASATPGVTCQADGELLGGLPARFRIQPGVLQCVTRAT